MKRPRVQQPKQSLPDVLGDLKAGYKAAATTRFRRRRTGFNPQGSGADYHYRSDFDYLRMMEIARDMVRNDAIVGTAIERAVTNIIHDGFTVDPRTGSDELDAALKERWLDWASDPEQCDAAGEWSFPDLEQMVCRHMLIDGDIVALPQQAGALELIEAHRLRTPRKTKRNVVHGVLLDDARRRLEYWFTRDDIDPTRSLDRVKDIKAYRVRDAMGLRQVFHVYNPGRVTQTRGVSALLPIIDVLAMFEDINFAKLLQQQSVSIVGLITNREVGGEYGDPPPINGESQLDLPESGTTAVVEGMGPGVHIIGAPGETTTAFQSNIPNSEFFDHINLMLSLVAVNLGLPRQVMMLDPSDTNFSGWRGAVDQAKRGFERNQGALIRRFHEPVWHWKVRQWMHESKELRKLAGVAIDDAGRLVYFDVAHVHVFGHRWNKPGWPYIEPLKDAKADQLRTSSNITSQRRMQAERGRDYEEIAKEVVEDRALLVRNAIAEAKAINQEDAEAKVDWRELAAFDPKGRKKSDGSRGMEDMARAVRAGVPIGEGEARVAMGLPADAVEGESLLRFNDQDVLAYHIESGVLTINEVRERLALPPVAWGGVPVRRQGIAPVEQKGSREGDTEEAENDSETEKAEN